MMKKLWYLVLFFLLLFPSLSSSQPLVGDLDFTSLKIDSAQLSEACEIYSAYFVADSSKEKFNENCAFYSDEISFPSQLDSTVRLYFSGDENRQYLLLVRAQDCIGPYPEDSTAGTPGTHQFSEVMLFELLRLQECGIIEKQRDSLEELLLSAIAQIKEKNKKCPDLDWGSFGENSGAGGSIIGPGCCSLVESSEALPRISKVSPGVRTTKLSPGKFRLSGVPLGAELSVFNLKGQMLLRKGFDGGLLEIPNVPAVARVGGNWVKLE